MSWSGGSGGGGGAGRHWLRWRSAAQIGFVIKDNGDNSNNRKFLATSTDILGLILNRSPSGESGSFE